MAWASRFGVASETTVVPVTPKIATAASAAEISDHGCVSDRLTVDGLPDGAEPITVTSRLLGPLTRRPAEGSTPEGWADFPLAGTVSTTIDTNGTHETPCIRVSAPGYYYFVFESDGSDPSVHADDGRGNGAADEAWRSASSSVVLPALVPAFSDTRVHESESVAVSAPSAPPSPAPTPPSAAKLAQTGGGGAPTAMSTTLAVIAIIAGLAVVGLASRRVR